MYRAGRYNVWLYVVVRYVFIMAQRAVDMG